MLKYSLGLVKAIFEMSLVPSGGHIEHFYHVSSSQAAILADEFVLTHKNVFSSVSSEKTAGSFSGQSSNF